MNLNLNTKRIAAAALGAGIALGAVACAPAAGEDDDAPNAPAPAAEQTAQTNQGGIGPRPSKDARLRCYPRIPADPDAEIPDRCFWE